MARLKWYLTLPISAALVLALALPLAATGAAEDTGSAPATAGPGPTFAERA